ncbi:TPA: gfo/Idh/MocA family oxidoreductase, partial [Candidatus Poribacteria bacterium]|nr:gfo/Idh/MocA family oxidoreductase [Candidatus Poribacteria bacterium]
MAYQHAKAYQDLENCELIACADIKPENAQAFADHCQLPNTYLSHMEMLKKEDLDIVSVC